jgi:hypothetical protein
MVALVWFRRDLRMHDHPALGAALAGHEQIAPVFCLDDRPAGTTRGRSWTTRRPVRRLLIVTGTHPPPAREHDAPAAEPRQGSARGRGRRTAARGTARHPPNYPAKGPIRSPFSTERRRGGKKPAKVVGAGPDENSYLCWRLPGPA